MILRVCLYSVVHENRVQFDITVDDNRVPLPHSTYFGVWGSLDGAMDCGLALLREDGTIDLGTAVEHVDRHNESNILTKRMIVGEYVTIYWKEDGVPFDRIYQIERISTRSETGSRSRVEELLIGGSASLIPSSSVRAKVIKTFEIFGYDETVYIPPVGVCGDLVSLLGSLIFAPDNAFDRNGNQIVTVVEDGCVELLVS